MQLGGFNLALQEKNAMTFQQENEQYAGDNIKLLFEVEELPQVQFQNEFKMNQDIGWVKHYISQKFGISHSDFHIFFQDKQMIDILSLSDFQGLASGSVLKIILNNDNAKQKILDSLEKQQQQQQ